VGEGLMAKLQDLARSFRLDANGLSAEMVGKELARVAKAENAKVQQEFRPSETRHFVDGRENAPEESAKAVILYRYSYWAEVIDEIYRMLVEASPVGPAAGGHYRDDHWLFVNGQRRDAATDGAVGDIPAGAEVVFVNARPYARKIEGGLRTIAGHMGDEGKEMYRAGGLSDQAPNGVYEITAKAAKSRFGNMVDIRFEYRRVVSGAALPGSVPIAQGGARGRRLRTGRGVGGRTRYPAIVMRLR
jgi:hypothetical protein